MAGAAGGTLSTEAARPPAVALDGIAKKFGQFVALRSITLSVAPGEFVCFLGPSGCGKTTLLRIVAGLERQNLGRVLMAGRDVSGLPPNLRNYGIVFQSYALFPNLTVAQNVAYGLETRRTPRADVDRRVDELLALVSLGRHRAKYPAQLSGGEQQRVALCRALAPSPALLLLDEPLSALDARVRQALRHEIRALQRRLGITTIMVTHDQEEALAMADRIVVMNHGGVEQVGDPVDVYRRPASPFVARFVGQMNFIPAEATGAPGRVRAGALTLQHDQPDALAEGTPVTLAIRPEEIRVGDGAGAAGNPVAARVAGIQFLGAFTRLTLTLPALGDAAVDCDVAAGAIATLGVTPGGEVPVALARDALRVFPGRP